MMYRVENKYECSEMDLRLLESRLKVVLQTDFHDENQMGYKVTSIYFDDRYDSLLQDTINGNRLREKYRIRIYNGSFDVIKLEVKYKRDNRVLKKSRNISKENMKSLLQGKCIRDESPSIDSAITLFNLAINQWGITPKVIVEYDRKAYVFPQGNTRITLDRNIRASEQILDFSQEKELYYERARGNDKVLEVKYDQFLPSFLAGILEVGNMNQTTCSKYRICREIKGEKLLCQ